MNSSGLTWRKSTRSGNSDNECVEVCLGRAEVLIRDSKDPGGPVLRVSTAAWATFVDAVQRDGLCG